MTDIKDDDGKENRQLETHKAKCGGLLPRHFTPTQPWSHNLRSDKSYNAHCMHLGLMVGKIFSVPDAYVYQQIFLWFLWSLSLETELVAARKKIDDQQGEIAELYCLQDNLEQYTIKQSLEICGIPDSLYSSSEEVVMKIAEVLEVPMSPEDINISHKIKSKGVGSILVKFQSHKAKSRLYKARTKLKNIRVTDVYPDASTVACVMVGQGRIFINENLTTFRKDLLKKANDKRKDGLIFSAWSLDGKILVKTSPEGDPIRIYEQSDLEDL